MPRSVKNQLCYCVRDSKAYGESKHADKSKQDGVRHGRTYSYTSMNARLDTAKQFGRWMKENHPEVKLAVDIKPEHMNEWLDTKAERCSKATLESYSSNLRTLTTQIANTYHKQICKTSDIITPISTKDPIRTKAFTNEDINKLQASFKPDSIHYQAIALEKVTGCRAEGLTKLTTSDIRIFSDDRAEVRVHGEKGGRERIVDVVGRDNIDALRHVKEVVPDGQRICPIKPDSLNRAFRRHMEVLGIKYDKTTTHAMRKCWAQNRYNEYRQTHTKYDTIRYINTQLGHGADRDVELLGRYVADIH